VVHKTLGAILAIGMVTLGAGQAYAATTKYVTAIVQFKLERNSDKRTFSGTIDSPKSQCVKSRKVELIRKHNGNQSTLGKDTTNDSGKFKIVLSSGQAKNGTYYAKVKTKDFDTNKTCEHAQSATIKVS
jgi:5-hydroxyisourate hydrolase-like protein (transthyretin family)